MTQHFGGGSDKTVAKLIILEEYLDVYITIMDKYWDQELWYVDTHAGTGRTVLDDTGMTVDGSSLRALENHVDSFDRFYLYELDEDHFTKLHETLAARLGVSFNVYETVADGDFMVARCDDPYIRIMQMDSNDGVSFLADKANRSAHWFTLIDPKGLTAKRSTLDTLIERGNMDILINYQTTGVLRSAAAEHAHRAVRRTMGDDDWPEAAEPDEYVRLFKEKLEVNREIAPVLTKKLVSPSDKRWRFDLVFACANDTARGIMSDIMNQDRLWEKVSEEKGQSGLGKWA